MIKEIPMYTVICDGCGKNSCDIWDYAGWKKKKNALACAKGADWIEKNNKHYCPDCYSSNDKVIINKKL